MGLFQDSNKRSHIMRLSISEVILYYDWEAVLCYIIINSYYNIMYVNHDTFWCTISTYLSVFHGIFEFVCFIRNINQRRFGIPIVPTMHSHVK